MTTCKRLDVQIPTEMQRKVFAATEMMRGPDAKRESIIMVGAKVSSQERLRSAAQPVHLQWTRVNFQVGERKILQNLNGDVQPGEVCAVMGPSGSGKTTLMDFVASRIDPSPAERILSGDVLLNHTAVRDPNTFANFGAYVPQEEALVGTLTASETLRFAARLTVGGNLRTRIDDIVEETINEMGLRVCADTVVGTVFRKGLSGGQKRRLSVAVELIRSPSLLVLDEPTSGLDSASAFALIDHLKGLGKNGHTIILSIHQPSSEIWGLFDKVGFMSAGQSVYFGPAGEKCLNYFKSIGKACPSYSNPADFIISLINADFPGRTRDDVKVLIEAYAQYEAKKETDRRTAQPERKTDEPYEHKHLQRPGFCERLTTLVHRDFLELIRDPGIIGVRLAMYSMLALMVGLMYLNLGNKKDFESVNSRISVLFYIAAFMVFMSVAVLPFFIIQRDVFLKERLNRAYNVPEYAISKFLTSLPGVFLLALLTTTLVVLQAKLNGFAIYLLTLFVSLLIAEDSIRLIVSTATLSSNLERRC
eukprot:jgi/Bigna1/85120/estExt_fgenesh1_pg.C_20227